MNIKPATRKAIRAILMVGSISAFFLAGCWTLGRDASSLDLKAVGLWHKNEVIFEKALHGIQRDDEFEHACLFFEQVTGLRMHVNFFTLGVAPTPETEQDLIRLRDWFKHNKHRLYWDEETGTVKVHPLPILQAN